MKYRYRIFPCVVLIAIATGCATTSLKDHEEKYADLTIEQLLDSKKLPEARKQELTKMYAERAENEASKGFHKSAEKYARMALNLTPEDTQSQLWLAYAQLGLGQLDSANGGFNKLYLSAPSALVNQGLGLTLLAQNKTQEAEIQLNEAVAKNPKLWRSWNGLGVIYDMSKSWGIAEKAFKAGIAVAEHNTTLNNNLGLSYLRQKKLQQAIIAFENVQALPGGKELSDLNFRTALALNGEMNRAVGGATDNEKAKLFNNLGVIHLEEGKPYEAIQYLKKAIAASPSYYPHAEKNLEIAKSSLS